MSGTLVVVLVVIAALAAALMVWRRPVLAFAQRTGAFTQDVRGEVRKITWPTWDDLRRSTIVISAIVLVIGLLIGVMDKLFSVILIQLLGRAFG